MVFPFWKLPTLVSRPWRLVRDLDGFDDERCRAFAADVLPVRALGLLAAFPTAMVVGSSLTIGAILASDGFPRAAWSSLETVSGRFAGVAFGLAMIAVTLSVAFTPYAVLIRRGLRRHISRAACPACRYSLLGLPLLVRPASDPAAVLCPECGSVIDLAARGLRPADILAGAPQPADSPAGRAPPPRRKALVGGFGCGILLTGWVISGSPVWLQVGFFAALAFVALLGTRPDAAEEP